MSRGPAVAGTFYPAEAEALRRKLADLTAGRRPPESPRAIALLVPHAGYVYSGEVAAATFLSTRLARRIVILGPNHTGRGDMIALMRDGSWTTPLGDVHLDDTLAAGVLDRCPAATVDALAHQREHSLEVQLPFLQHLVGEIRILPVCVGTMQLSLLLELGQAIAETIRDGDGEVLLVLSSDLSHYLPAEAARREDFKALAPILAIDPVELHRVVTGDRINMCGVAPTVAGLEAARNLGASAARLVAYDHSGTTSGDHAAVVGYAGVAVT